jgi:hypothetical protein
MWSVIDGLGNELGTGMHIVTDEFPEWKDSLCLAAPLTCYQMNLSLNDTITGLTYLDYALSANGVAYSGFLNVVQKETLADFNFQPGVNCFGTGVDEVMQEKIKVYPNPAQDHITLDFPLNEKNQVLQIFNGLGQKVLESAKFTSDKNVLEISALVNGIYTIVVGQESIRLVVTR